MAASVGAISCKILDGCLEQGSAVISQYRPAGTDYPSHWKDGLDAPPRQLLIEKDYSTEANMTLGVDAFKALEGTLITVVTHGGETWSNVFCSRADVVSEEYVAAYVDGTTAADRWLLRMRLTCQVTAATARS